MGRESSIPVRVGHFYSCCAESAFCCKENALEYTVQYQSDDVVMVAIQALSWHFLRSCDASCDELSAWKGRSGLSLRATV